MSQNKHIHVRRYPTPAASGGVEATIAPEDGAFFVLIPVDGDAVFYRRVAVTNSEGQTDHDYIDVELPARTSAPPDGVAPPTLAPLPAVNRVYPYPIDFHVKPIDPNDPTLEDLDDEAQKFTPSKQRPGFWAWLNCRAVMTWGPTEHEAIQALMNYAVSLAVAGCLDQTGHPVPHINRRRYEAVFGTDVTPGYGENGEPR